MHQAIQTVSRKHNLWRDKRAEAERVRVQCCFLRPQKPYRTIRDWGAQDGHLDFWHSSWTSTSDTAPELCQKSRNNHLDFHTAPELWHKFVVQCCFSPQRPYRTIRDGEPRTATSTSDTAPEPRQKSRNRLSHRRSDTSSFVQWLYGDRRTIRDGEQDGHLDFWHSSWALKRNGNDVRMITGLARYL